MKKEEIVQFAIDAVLDNYRAFEERKEKWLDMVKRYENKLREGSISSKTDSKIALGGAFALVENAIPRLLNRQPKYKYISTADDDTAAAMLYEEYSNYQWKEADVEPEIENVVRWGLTTGMAGWKMGWKEETLKRSKRERRVLGVKVSNPVLNKVFEKLGTGKMEKVDVNETIANYTFRAVSPFDLIWNTDALEFKDVRAFGSRERKSLRELKQMGYDTSNLTAQLMSDDYWARKLDMRDGTIETTEKRPAVVGDDYIVSVAEMYVSYLNEEGIRESSVVTLAYPNGCQPIEIGYGPNPFDKQFIPYGVFVPIKRLGKMYGYGLVEVTSGVLDAEEDTINIGITTLWTDLARPMEYNPQNLLDVNSFKYGARQLIPVRRLGESVNVLQTPQPNIGGVQYVEQFLNRAKQNISGITDYMTGADQQRGEKTLGEIQMKTQESNARLSKIMRNLETQVIERVGLMALWMNQQFLADKQKIMFRVLGKKGEFLQKEIKFKNIEAIKDITIIAGSTAMLQQQAELAKWTAFLNQCYLENRQPNPVPIDREPAWVRLIEDGMLEKNVEQYLPNIREREEEMVENEAGQLEDAKSENEKPMTARVLPTDNPSVHVPLHKAEIEARKAQVEAAGMQGQDPALVEELQMLMQHLNDHIVQAGGRVPQFAEPMGAEQGTEGMPEKEEVESNMPNNFMQ